MNKWLARIFSQKPQARSLEATAGGRRWAADTGFGGPLNAALQSMPTVRRRAMHVHRNNAYASRASAILSANIVGCGILPQSEHQDPDIRALVDLAWRQWTNEADAGGVQSLYGLQALVARGFIETGEAFALLRVPPPNGRAVPLAVQLLDPSQVDATLNRDVGNGVRIIGGIEVDAVGKRLAYHVLPTPQGDPFATSSWQAVRIPADQVLHIYEPLEPGALRGVPWIAPALLRLHELDLPRCRPGSTEGGQHVLRIRGRSDRNGCRDV